MKSSFFGLLLLAFFGAFTVAAQETVANASGGRDTVVNVSGAHSYQIGPGDVIEGKVLGEPQFDFKTTVDEDGNIQVAFSEIPLMARCKSEKELKTDVTKLVSRYVRNPQVGVNVVERKSRPPAVVSGEVRLQAQIDLRRTTRLLELIAFSNGLTKDASGMIEVFHTQPPICADENEASYWKADLENIQDVPSRMYSYSSLKEGKDVSNPIIYPGDLIVVRKSPPVYVIGEVVALKEIGIPETGLSLMEAIAQAGGFNREAKTKEVTIQRLKPNSKEREFVKVNYDLIKNGKQKDLMLQPEDIVVVDKAKKSIAATIIDIATGSAQSFGNVLPQRIMY
jgi:polysaccharide biosynthesis/export protein